MRLSQSALHCLLFAAPILSASPDEAPLHARIPRIINERLVEDTANMRTLEQQSDVEISAVENLVITRFGASVVSRQACLRRIVLTPVSVSLPHSRGCSSKGVVAAAFVEDEQRRLSIEERIMRVVLERWWLMHQPLRSGPPN